MRQRSERVSALIKEELGKIILRDIEFPGLLVTITDVSADEKLEGAKIAISVIPEAKSKEALTILETQAGDLQWKLLKKLNIRPMPRIRFVHDTGAEKAARVEKLLREEDNNGSLTQAS